MAVSIDWTDIHNNRFKKVYDSIKNLETKPIFTKLDKLPQEKKSLLCKKYFKLFDISCDLLNSYLVYNGTYQQSKILVLRKAYNLEVVNDGQKWINLFFIFRNYKQHCNQDTEKFVLAHLNSTYLKIFDDLNLFMEKEAVL